VVRKGAAFAPSDNNSFMINPAERDDYDRLLEALSSQGSLLTESCISGTSRNRVKP